MSQTGKIIMEKMKISELKNKNVNPYQITAEELINDPHIHMA